MGIFSGKTKVYVGISNSRLYETEDIPNSIKDSTAGYIKDIGEGKNNDNYITDYNRLAIEDSVVMGIKKAFKFANKDTNNYVKYDSTEVAFINPETIEIELENKILSKARTIYPEAEINYYSYAYLDMAHIVKVALDKDYNWNSYNNTMEFDGLNGWLYSIDITLADIQEEPSLGNSFASGETATRIKDTSRPFKPFIYEENIEEKFLIKFMPKYTKSITNTKRVYKDKTLDEVTKEENESTVNSDDKPIDESSTVYKTNNINETVNVYDDPTDSNIEITETITELSELSYGSIKQKTRYFKDYINELPADLPVIDGESPTPELSPSLIDYIDKINNGEITPDSLEGNLVTLISLRIDSNTNKHIIVSDFSDTGLEGTIAEGIRELLYSKVISGFIPALHIKVDDEVLKPEDEEWRTNNIYAKRLSIKLNGLYEKITESMENDRDKVRHCYIQFGVNIESDNNLEIKYMYDYFSNELNGEAGSNAKAISLRTTSTRDVITWDSISKGVINKAITSEYVNETQNNNIALYKRISDTECEYIIVLDYGRKCTVSGSTFGGGKQGKASEDSFTLLPIDYYLMNTSIKGFKNKEHFIYRCMYIEFLTYVKVKSKWYQTGAFKALAVIVGAVIIYVTGGSGSYLSALLVSAATAYAIEVAIKVAIKAFGPKYGRYIAIAIGIIALGKGFNGAAAASAAGANVTKILSAFLMNAKTYLSIANQFLNQSTQALGIERQEEMEDKNRELQAFKEQTAVLLGSRVNDVSYQVNRNYISSYIVFGSIDDITEQFLDLNKIDTCIQYVHNCIDYLISIPTIDESVSGILGVK